MKNKYIKENKNSYAIVKSSKIYAKTTKLDDALFIRDLLVENNWNIDKIPQILKNDEEYWVLAQIDDKIHLLAKYKTAPSEERVRRLIKKRIRNPNNSRYGLNIIRYFDIFIIKKSIFGEDYIFGYYDALEDAEFVRNFLMDHNWDVNRFDEIEFDDESNTYKVISVIDDTAYVLDSFKSEDIDLKEVYSEFLSKISKHKYGLANYPHLDLLKDRIEELELEFGVKSRDDTWSFDNLGSDASPLNEIVFTMTPFQKSVYDAVSTDTGVSEIEKALIRYKSKNFTAKIQKNLDELLKKDLIVKNEDDTYSKKNL